MKRVARVAMLTCMTTCSASVVLAPVRVAAGTMTGAATEWTQITNFVTLCMQIVQQIQTVASLAQTVKAWGTTLKNIDSPQDVMNVAQGINGIIARTRSIAFQGASLAARANSLTGNWQRVHPGEVDPTQVYKPSPTANGPQAAQDGSPQGIAAASAQADDQVFRQVDESLQAAVAKAFETLDMHADEATDDAAIFEKLSTKMQTVEGARQVGMMTNELLLNITRILMRLGETCDRLAYVTGEYASANAQKSQYERAIRKRRGRYTGRFRGDQVSAGDSE